VLPYTEDPNRETWVRLLPAGRDLGFAPYVWLVYIIPFVLEPFFRGAGPVRIGLTLLGTLAFLALYFLGYWLSGRRLLLVVAGHAALGVAFSPSNRGAVALFIYAAAHAAWTGPPRVALGVIVGVVASVAAATLAFALPVVFFAIAAVFSLIIGGVNIHFAEVQRRNARLRLAQEEVERLATIAERERIARDLHDLLGHTLSTIVLKSELASKLAGRDPERAAGEIRDVERISRQALQEVRSAVTGYRTTVQAELARAREALEAAGVAFDARVEPIPLAAAHESVLALAIREAVTNVVRHSRARSCRLRLAREDARARLEIQDDGEGGLAPEGVGLQSMRERIVAVGGTLERRGDAGTRLLIAVPLAEPG
jgi:two-component system sensor histidine kinase DesK